MKFALRLPGPDPQREHYLAIRDVQLSLAQNARTLVSILAGLGETIQKSDDLICYIEDAEVRAQLRLMSESIHSEFWVAVTAALKLTAACQKTNA